MTRTGAEAIRWAKAQHTWPRGYCQAFAHDCFGVGARDGSARLGWLNSNRKHRTTDPNSIPAAVPIFWLGGSHGYGHVAFSLGNGLCRSTDWPHAGTVGTARVADIQRVWGEVLVGWTEDINGVPIWHGGSKSNAHVIDLSEVRAATRSASRVHNGVLLKKAVAAEVGTGHMHTNADNLGAGFQTQYKLVQEKFLHEHGVAHPKRSDVDGLPGRTSLTWLGERHGFLVQG